MRTRKTDPALGADDDGRSDLYLGPGFNGTMTGNARLAENDTIISGGLTASSGDDPVLKNSVRYELDDLDNGDQHRGGPSTD